MTTRTKNRDSLGFTIVELLLVIVVIGILASITIVSYTGISQRAKAALLESDLSNVAKIIRIDQTLSDDETYPNSKEDINNGVGFPENNGTSYQYQSNNLVSPKTFCVTATNDGLSYYTNQDISPTIGGCPGDIVQGYPSIANPSFENDEVSNSYTPQEWTHFGDAGNLYEGVADDFASHGTHSYKISHEDQGQGNMDGGIRTRISGLEIGQKVSVSAWIKTGPGVSTATLVLCTSQGTGGNITEDANQGENVEGRFTVTIDNVDAEAVDLFIGQGAFTGSSTGDVWFDGLQVIVD